MKQNKQIKFFTDDYFGRGADRHPEHRIRQDVPAGDRRW
jgi:hypothetical protein